MPRTDESLGGRLLATENIPKLTQGRADVLERVIAQEYQRAGLPLDPKEEARKILAGDEQATSTLSGLLLSGDPDATEDQIPEAYRPYRPTQLKDFKGRGWSRSDIEALHAQGKDLQPLQFSEGGKQADGWANNRNYITDILEMERQRAGVPEGHWKHDRITQMQNNAAENWASKVGRDFGESGWTGFMDNPSEYAFPALVDTVFDPLYHAWAYGLQNEQTDGNKKGFWNALFSDVPTHLELRRAAGKIDPILPGDPKTPEEKEAAYRQLKTMVKQSSSASPEGPTAFEMKERRENSQYPSYAGSTVAETARNFLDPTTLLGIGKAASSLKLLPKIAAHQIAEEIPTYAGMAGSMTAYNEYAQRQIPDESQRQVINWGGLFTPGNETRTDLPKHIREENQTDFINRDLQEQKAREEALKKAPEVLKSIPSGRRRIEPGWSGF